MYGFAGRAGWSVMASFASCETTTVVARPVGQRAWESGAEKRAVGRGPGTRRDVFSDGVSGAARLDRHRERTDRASANPSPRDNETMTRYVDGFVIPVPKKKLATYLRMARRAAAIWREHGALDFKECTAEQLDPGAGLPFPRGIRARPGETIVFSWIGYESDRESVV